MAAMRASRTPINLFPSPFLGRRCGKPLLTMTEQENSDSMLNNKTKPKRKSFASAQLAS
jgi:hypothetical protein